MCGIVGIVSRPSTRPAPSADELLSRLDAATAAEDLDTLMREVAAVDRMLHGLPGVLALVDRHELVAAITSRLDQIDATVVDAERALEATDLDADELEVAGARLIAARDVLWAVRHDRLRTALAVAALAGRDASVGALAGYLSVQQALSAIDRLEVRGRDSAGLHLFVWGDELPLHDQGMDDQGMHDRTAGDPTVAALVDARRNDPLFQSGSVRSVMTGATPCLSFVYKAAAEIGELGDNTRALRAAVHADTLLRRALAVPGVRVAVLGHTRWASVGIISEPNTHPLNSEELEARGGDPSPYVVAALNGDVDNHADLRVEHALRINAQITTDAKVIPALVARHGAAGADLVESFRRTVAASTAVRSSCSMRTPPVISTACAGWRTTVARCPSAPTTSSSQR
jgi:glucosamine--fructose-6-phosphate aminotransferase (isomerizing)